jgi:hypothetical protein
VRLAWMGEAGRARSFLAAAGLGDPTVCCASAESSPAVSVAKSGMYRLRTEEEHLIAVGSRRR